MVPPYIAYLPYLYFQIKVDHHPTSDSGIKVVCDYDEEEEKTCQTQLSSSRSQLHAMT